MLKLLEVSKERAERKGDMTEKKGRDIYSKIEDKTNLEGNRLKSGFAFKNLMEISEDERRSKVEQKTAGKISMMPQKKMMENKRWNTSTTFKSIDFDPDDVIQRSALILKEADEAVLRAKKINELEVLKQEKMSDRRILLANRDAASKIVQKSDIPKKKRSLIKKPSIQNEDIGKKEILQVNQSGKKTASQKKELIDDQKRKTLPQKALMPKKKDIQNKGIKKPAADSRDLTTKVKVERMEIVPEKITEKQYSSELKRVENKKPTLNLSGKTNASKKAVKPSTPMKIKKGKA